MRKIIFILVAALAWSFGGSPKAVAGDELDALYGRDLKKADFVIRYKFQQKTKVAWEKSNLSQRQRFLEQWHRDDKDQEKLKVREEREKRNQERQARNAAHQKQRVEQGLIRAKALKARNEKKVKENDKKEFNGMVDDRVKKFIDMRKKDNARRRRPS